MSEYQDYCNANYGPEDIREQDDYCPNCGGEGVVYNCQDEIGCVDPEGGCDLCERRCDWCGEQSHDSRVYFMCQSCEEHNPEGAVGPRSDIAVMPDGTWLCDSCYSDCEKSAYGLIASDVDDFEFPRFEDLPRPTPYAVSPAQSSGQPKLSEAAILEMAKLIDGEAWIAIMDGRDAAQGSMWNHRRDFALRKANGIASALRDLYAISSTEPLPPDWKQDQAETSRLAPRISSTDREGK